MPKQTLLLPRTATIEVKTLIQNGRAVSKSFFAQVPERDVFLPNGALNPNAVYVGRVNYCPGSGKCNGGHYGRYDDHDHLLWMEDGLPYRCRLFSSLYSWCGSFKDDSPRAANWTENNALLQQIEQIYV